MNNENKKKTSKDHKKAKFPSKNIKHDPQAESARAVFGLNEDNFTKKD